MNTLIDVALVLLGGISIVYLLINIAHLVGVLAAAWWEGGQPETDKGVNDGRLKPVVIHMRIGQPSVTTPQEAVNHSSVPRLRSPLGDGTDRELYRINVKRVCQESDTLWDVELTYKSPQPMTTKEER